MHRRRRCRFEGGCLGLLGAMVAVLIGVAVSRPPAFATAVPRATVAVPAETRGRDAAAERTSFHPLRLAASARGLGEAFRRLGYDFRSVLDGESRVPRVLLTRLPPDLGELGEIESRKALFFRTVLPLVLHVNEEILADRRRLWRIAFRRRMEERLDALDRLWLDGMGERYGVAGDDLEGLLRRLDAIPPSLALAQSAEESGWGTSRFVREGNALFGQWVVADDGHLVPAARDPGKLHRVKGFATLLDSVRAYAFNLNTHRAYEGLRKAREEMRRQGRPLDGRALARRLASYSARGKAYVDSVRWIIAANGLAALDDARLHDGHGLHEPAI